MHFNNTIAMSNIFFHLSTVTHTLTEHYKTSTGENGLTKRLKNLMAVYQFDS